MIVLGVPKCVFFRRRNAPTALSEWWSPLAARRRALCPGSPSVWSGTDDLTTGDSVVRAQPQPGGEMTGGRPSVHVQPDLANHLQRRVGTHAVDPGQVPAGHPVEVTPDIEIRRVLLLLRPAGFLRRGGLPSRQSANRSSWASISRSHSAILPCYTRYSSNPQVSAKICSSRQCPRGDCIMVASFALILGLVAAPAFTGPAPQPQWLR